MVRSRRLSLLSVLHDAAGVAVLLLFMAAVAVLAACKAVADLVEALLEQWFGVVVVLVIVALFAGCASAPAPTTPPPPSDTDPAIWRPKNPVYPSPL